MQDIRNLLTPHGSSTSREGESNSNSRSDSNITIINAKVQNLRKRGYVDLVDFLAASPQHLYIGRHIVYVKGAVGSKWQNPYKLTAYGNDVDKVLALYKAHVLNGPLHRQLHELRGKTLACWCHPARCHGDVLKELLEADLTR